MKKRTRKEIDVEKFAMKALRGDFDGIESSADRVELADQVICAVCNYSSGYACKYGAFEARKHSRIDSGEFRSR